MVAVQLPVTTTSTVRYSLAPVSLGCSVSSWAVAALAIVSAATRPTAAPPTMLVILTRDLLISCRRPDAGGLPRDGPHPGALGPGRVGCAPGRHALWQRRPGSRCPVTGPPTPFLASAPGHHSALAHACLDT